MFVKTSGFVIIVLAMACSAYGTIYYEIMDGTALAGPDLQLGQVYMVVLGGASGDVPLDGALVPGDWSNISLSDPIAIEDFDIQPIIPGPGWSYTSKDPGPGGFPSGDWISWDFSADSLGSYQLDFYDYAASTTTPAAVLSGYIVPEPMTIALLGLGGLALLNRKKIQA